ncbi:D-alanine transaminase [Halobacillus karajensis]|uniref:D-alanine aminotransferase n=1 Tax=Halobacillus karajensis TaxID=195088 RepID=A0A059NZI3_9BACI|nr:D-amino-acid transaminase [Halobacillus karajensis]CDQ21164.1 D-alanine aminotransferase [Halobacillus karajensis]CDQ24772.1 D-alanine aminotransferase [Halobacillus karajensis]CDQ28868.1 D-alanine aminotransferase [Halobacillus karajensis]SEH95410.1 D-alanine transaminase [Halobacillus karajensis]
MAIYNHILTENDFVEQNTLKYPFEERGLQFGDGIYEVIRVYKGNYYLIDEHVERLYRSAAAVKIAVPYRKEDLYQRLDELLKKNDVDGDASVYLQITRGSAPRDHAFPYQTNANLYAYVKDLSRPLEFLREGVTAITQEDVRWDWCYIKSLNLLPNVLAKQAAKESGSYEAILHKNGEVTECSSSNVYFVRDGKVYTHPAKKNILHGCVRMRVEAFCKEENIEFIEEAFRIEDLPNAEELFLSSSTSEVMPLLKVDGQKIGDGRPGPITRKLQQCYEKDANILAEDSFLKEQAATE